MPGDHKKRWLKPELLGRSTASKETSKRRSKIGIKLEAGGQWGGGNAVAVSDQVVAPVRTSRDMLTGVARKARLAGLRGAEAETRRVKMRDEDAWSCMLWKVTRL